jgi:phosphopantothenoylcysteine decarboxylase/phosphopantothenate--cysteine ligase
MRHNHLPSANTGQGGDVAGLVSTCWHGEKKEAALFEKSAQKLSCGASPVAARAKRHGESFFASFCSQKEDSSFPVVEAMAMSLAGKRVLLIVAGGIAAFKAIELIRLLRKQGCAVRCVLTRNGAEFVTPLTLQALSEDRVYTDLFSLTDESEMGHIQLSRSADLLVAAPATADLLARMATGRADDLASTVLLATDKPVLVAPAMNVRMWRHAATQANMATLRARGIHVIGPDEGVMACNEYGPGRLAEPPAILEAIAALLLPARPLAGRHVLVTSGPTHEPIDPVRYIANRSSGRQGHAIAAALAALGARVTLVSGPGSQPDPEGVAVIRIETARQMLDACQAALPADAAVFAAAVADWRIAHESDLKLKKTPGGAPPALALVPNPDILATIAAAGPHRPRLVVGFAAETHGLETHAEDKRRRKNADWIVANDVNPATGIMGGAENEVHLVTEAGIEAWPRLDKAEVARRLAARIAEALTAPHTARSGTTTGAPSGPGPTATSTP